MFVVWALSFQGFSMTATWFILMASTTEGRVGPMSLGSGTIFIFGLQFATGENIGLCTSRGSHMWLIWQGPWSGGVSGIILL